MILMLRVAATCIGSRAIPINHGYVCVCMRLRAKLESTYNFHCIALRHVEAQMDLKNLYCIIVKKALGKANTAQ